MIWIRTPEGIRSICLLPNSGRERIKLLAESFSARFAGQLVRGVELDEAAGGRFPRANVF